MYFGHYPDSMRQQLKERLPTFTEEESALVKGSNDFYGMNHYTANFIKHLKGEPTLDDISGHAELLPSNKVGEYIGPETECAWLRPNATGFRKMLKWISDRYGRPAIYVTENGTSVKGESDLPLDQMLEDDFRTQYFQDYIEAMSDAVCVDNVDVRGYLAWSLLE